MIKFADILKSGFLEEFAAISIGGMLTAILLAMALSVFIVFIYRITYAGVAFSRSFGGCLILIGMVTALVIQVITSNVVLSLGMVGALSIVRFRTAVKEASDTAFMFWSIATGIVSGAGYITIAILATALIGLLFVAVYWFGKKYKAGNYMVIVRFDDNSETEQRIAELPGYKMKNKTISANTTELVAELHLSDEDMEKLSALRDLPGVYEISIMRSVSGSVL